MGIAVAAAFGLEYLNKTLRNEDDIEEQIGLPVLATIQYYGDLRPVRQIAAEEHINPIPIKKAREPGNDCAIGKYPITTKRTKNRNLGKFILISCFVLSRSPW